MSTNINGINNKLKELKLRIHDTHADHYSGNQTHP